MSSERRIVTILFADVVGSTAIADAMDPEDVRQLLSVIDHVRNRAMVLILLRTGMRIGELLNLRVEDVDLRACLGIHHECGQ